MLDDKAQAELNAVRSSATIIVAALCVGVAAFASYVIFLHPVDTDQQAVALTYISLGLAAFQIVLAIFFPRMLAAAQRRKIDGGTLAAKHPSQFGIETDAGKLAQVYVTTMIVGCALLECAAFFALVAYMLEGQLATLAAAGVLLLGIALHLPLGSRISSWVKRQLRILEEEKQLPRRDR